MGVFHSSTQNPLGLNAGLREVVRATMRGGTGSKGQIVRFDLGASDGDVNASTKFGLTDGPTANVLAATNTHNGFQTTLLYIYGVLMDDVADNGQVDVCIRGVVQALGGDTSAAGTGLAAGAGSELITVIDGVRCCAVALETLADGALKWVAFNGIEGFANTHDVSS